MFCRKKRILQHLLTRGASAQGSLSDKPSTAPSLAPHDSPLLSKIQAVIQFRLAQLSNQARELAGLAATMGRSFRFAEKSGIHDSDAERWRLRGELTLQLDAPSAKTAAQSEAETCFLHAIEIAQSQLAKSLELRAVMSLSRLCQSQGKTAEALEMLAAIYSWFSEGFDMPDLQAARILLEELEGL